jgi:hypothetical protein
MKKFIFFTALTITCFSASAQSVQNPGFETWVPNNETGHTYQMPQHFVTGDIITTFFQELFGNTGYVVNSVTQTGVAHAGNYAVQMGVAISNFGDTVAGSIFYSNSVSDLFDGGGLAFTQRPANFTGWKKWNRVGTDTAGLFLMMTKWNPATQSRDTVAYEDDFYLTTSATSWSQFTVPITYLMNVYPDTIMVGAANISTHPHMGSVLTVDDFAFSGSVPIGMNEIAATVISSVVMPNPFNEHATLHLIDLQVNNATLEVYDVLGNKVRQSGDLSGSNFLISREGLPAGIYFYRLREENALIATGKFSVE